MSRDDNEVLVWWGVIVVAFVSLVICGYLLTIA
jgi:hypothetical protein